MSGMEIEEFKPLTRNTLRGFVRLRLPSGLILHDVAIHRRDDRMWVSPPGRPMVDRAGGLVRADGKIRYSPTIEFASREIADRFSAAVIEALRIAHPDALS